MLSNTLKKVRENKHFCANFLHQNKQVLFYKSLFDITDGKPAFFSKKNQLTFSIIQIMTLNLFELLC
jgi:hypothetical protein